MIKEWDVAAEMEKKGWMRERYSLEQQYISAQKNDYIILVTWLMKSTITLLSKRGRRENRSIENITIEELGAVLDHPRVVFAAVC